MTKSKKPASSAKTNTQIVPVDLTMLDINSLLPAHQQKFGARLTAIKDDQNRPLPAGLVEQIIDVSFLYLLLIAQHKQAPRIAGSNEDGTARNSLLKYYEELKKSAQKLTDLLDAPERLAIAAHFRWDEDSDAWLKYHQHLESSKQISEHLKKVGASCDDIIQFLKTSHGASKITAPRLRHELVSVLCELLSRHEQSLTRAENGVLGQILKALDIYSTGTIKTGLNAWQAIKNRHRNL